MVTGKCNIDFKCFSDSELIWEAEALNSTEKNSRLVSGGVHEKRLLNDLLDNYNVLERPVFNESEPLPLSFGLTLMQIIDVVSQQ
ncbi:hypothetical protein KQX54_020485 [Cotesia glomerata]|uniref:Neurotransmitter-gated ion-channel ligand-binding domain-containing protein n=1 Tax=Cotesia glomerata TaxID=32391 RepID=A0AAV7I1K9_COTGL|nr:hypothetical protein KQX54_020485 [Cotesia glomerata]